MITVDYSDDYFVCDGASGYEPHIDFNFNLILQIKINSFIKKKNCFCFFGLFVFGKGGWLAANLTFLSSTKLQTCYCTFTIKTLH